MLVSNGVHKTFFFITSEPHSRYSLRVVVGQHNRSKSENTTMTFEVDQLCVHPLYLARRFNNDIALIKLKGSIEYCREVVPVCLPEKDVSPGTICVTTGWGDTKGEHEKIFVHNNKKKNTR